MKREDIIPFWQEPGFRFFTAEAQAWMGGYEPTAWRDLASAKDREKSRIAAESRARMMEFGTPDQKAAAKGTLEGIFRAPAMGLAPAMQSKRKPFKFQPNSLAERVYAVLPADGSPALGTELWRRFNVTSKVLSKTLEPAIRASVVVRVRVGGSHAARFARGKVAPEVNIPTL